MNNPVYYEVSSDIIGNRWMQVDAHMYEEYVANGWQGRKLYATPAAAQTAEPSDELAAFEAWEKDAPVVTPFAAWKAARVLLTHYGAQPAASAEPGYRLLGAGEVMLASDECLCDDYTTWESVAGIFVGMRYVQGMKPVRRLAAPVAAPPMTRCGIRRCASATTITTWPMKN